MNAAATGLVAAATTFGLEAILVKPRRSIGTLIPYVVVEEVHQDRLEITEHPIEQGAAIADHAYKRPAELTLRCGWSNSPAVSGLLSGLAAAPGATVAGVQSILSGNATSQVREVYDKLLQLQASREPFTVYTGKRVYQNMLLQALSVTTDAKSENSLIVVASLRQIIIVQTQLVTISAPASAQTDPGATQPPSNKGVKALQPAPNFRPSTTY